jgi:hypothetical protein
VRTGGRVDGLRPLLSGLAYVLGLLAIEGVAWGLSPFGVALSAWLGVYSAALLAVARFAPRAAAGRLAVAATMALVGCGMAEGAVRMLHIGGIRP